MLTKNRDQPQNLKAWLFPGQGSQDVGMGKPLFEVSARSRQTLEIAEQLSGFPLRDIMSRGPSQLLARSEVVQPAIVALSCCYIDLLWDHDVHPDFVTGHSLGELSALYAAGVLKRQDVLRLATERGQLMAEGPPGGMLAVKNMPLAELEEILGRLPEGTCCIANLNAPSQLVVSGDEPGLISLNRLLNQRSPSAGQQTGPRPTTTRLSVSGAWHSPLVAVANHEFSKRINCVQFSEPHVPIAMSSLAAFVTSASDLRNSISRQMTRPVRWYETIELLLSAGATEFWEVGCGKVLKGLMRRIVSPHRNCQVESLGSGRVLKRLLDSEHSQTPYRART